MLEIIDNQQRSRLGEGRNYQMGFGFAKKIKPNTYETVMPISACRDYLNDVVWSEITGKEISAHGLTYSKKNIYDNGKAYMLISILPRQGGNEYNNMAADIANLNENIENLVKFLNYFEKELKLKNLSVIDKVRDNLYLVTFDHYWCTSTCFISLYSLLIRAGQFYKTGKPTEFLENFQAFPPDTYLVSGMFPKLKKILAGAQVTQNCDVISGYTVHKCGIMALNLT